MQENAQTDLIGVRNSTLPVVMIADLTAAGLQLGWRDFTSPTRPATWGHDIEVPDIILKRVLRLSYSCSEGDIFSL